MTRPSWSLAHRLAWRLAAVLLVSVGLAAATVGWRAIATVRALDDTALQAQARAVADHLSGGAEGEPRLSLPPALAQGFEPGPDSSVYLVTDAKGHVRLNSDPGLASLLMPYLPTQGGLFRVPPSPAQATGMVGYMLRVGPWFVAVAQGNEQGEALVRSLLAEFFSTGLLLLAGIGAVAVAVAVWTVRDGLRSVRAASSAAAHIDPAVPGRRLPDTALPAEVIPLVAAVNQALSRLEAALSTQRRFVGDAAHTLRTPLAVLTARLDSLPPDALVEALRRDADRMARLIEQMLQVARLDGQGLDVTQQVELRTVAVEAISALGPLAVQRGVELALKETAAIGPVLGNHAALVIALTNLIENALAHAPGGSLVEVELTPPACIRVLDRGPGVAPADRTAVFRRFSRGVGSPVGGAGLGLAIVAGIAAAHHGAARVDMRPGGGAAFVLELGTALIGSGKAVTRPRPPNCACGFPAQDSPVPGCSPGNVSPSHGPVVG
jgi:signal transduction histidine kinase